MNISPLFPSAAPGPLTEQVLAALSALTSAGEQRVTAGGGARIAWKSWGSGHPVVLIHGGAGSWRHWVRNITALAEHYTVLAPDMPGYGDSDLPADPHSLESMAGALCAGLEELLPREPRMHLVGFSFGSMVSIRMAQRLGARVDQLILVGSRFVDAKSLRWSGLVNWRRATEPKAREAALRHNMRKTMIADDARIDALALHLYGTDILNQRLKAAALRDVIGVPAEILKVLPKVRITGISGRGDQAYGDIQHLQAPGLATVRPGAAFHVIDDASHWVMYEQASTFNQWLLRTLAG